MLMELKDSNFLIEFSIVYNVVMYHVKLFFFFGA